jgi:CBS domain-containing protein
VVALPASATVEELRDTVMRAASHRGQHLYPIVDNDRRVVGVITRKGEVLREPVVAYADEPLRAVVQRMAETGRTRMPVVDRDAGQLAGMVSLRDLLTGRVRNLQEERRRERVLRVRIPFGRATSATPK